MWLKYYLMILLFSLSLDDAVALLVIDGRPTKDAFEGEQAYFDLYFFC